MIEGRGEDALRERLATWMRTVMERNEWSAEEWARRANTAATNITRFLRAEQGFMPTVRTLAKLANAAGSAPDLTPRLPTVEIMRLPLLGTREIISVASAIKRGDRGMVNQLLREANVATVPVPAAVGAGSFAITLTHTTLDLAGILSGDTVIVDPNTPPRHGDKVATFDGDAVAAYLYHPPYLMPKSADVSAQPRPLDSAVVLGVIKHLLRNIQ